MVITAGIVAQCSQACKLVEGLDAENLLTDKGGNGDVSVEKRMEEGRALMIPPRKN